MKRVLTAVVLIPLVLLLVFKAPPPALVVVAALVAFAAAREYLSILTHYGLEPSRITVYVALAVLFGNATWESMQSGFLHPSALSGYLPFTLLFFGILLFRAMFHSDLKTGTLSAVLSGFALIYIAFPLLLLAEWTMPSDDVVFPGVRFYIAALLVLVWASDICAFATGRAIGKRLLAPRISPKKTWEGAIGSLIGALLVGVGAWVYVGRSSGDGLPYWLLLAFFINLAAQVGDLVESLFKRGAGIKDSGHMLPGHGGVLDRVDALLFAVPVMWYFDRSYFWLRDLIFG